MHRIENSSFSEELNGVRGIAVLLVLLVHFNTMSFGWVGVQIFFVLSGYFISKALYLAKSKSNSLSDYIFLFYFKRAFRILPAYISYVILFILFSLYFRRMESVVQLSIPLITFTTNLFSVNNVKVDFTGVGHFWTLSLEEQFYIFWPFIIYYFDKKRFCYFLFLLIILSPIFRFFYFDYNYLITRNAILSGGSVNVFPLSHLDAFACGSLVFLIDIVKTYLDKYIVILCLIGISVLFILVASISLVYNFHPNGFRISYLLTLGFPPLLLDNYGYVWGYSFLNLIFGLLVYLILKCPEVFRLLKSHILSFTGKISYSLYIYHVPVIIFTDYLAGMEIFTNKLIHLLINFLLAYILAYLSFKFIESKFILLREKYMLKFHQKLN